VNRWKAILAATLIFATGAASGILVFRAASTTTPQRSRESGMPPGPGENRPDFLGRLKRDLSLSDAQATRIDTLLQEGRKRNRAIWESIQPQMREESKRVRESIQAELNPEQRAKYDEFMKQRSRDRRGPGPDGSWRRGGPPGTNNSSGGTNGPAAIGAPTGFPPRNHGGPPPG
jgi:Spy/CpxP family protein refolding chaperone